MRMNNYNTQLLNSFKLNLFNSPQGNQISPAMKDAYVLLYRNILLSTEMTDKELYQLAKKIKPIVRLRRISMHKYILAVGQDRSDDLIVFADTYPLFESYFYGFDIDRAYHVNEKPFIVLERELKQTAEFTCYHVCDDEQTFLRPTAAEVLQQMPEEMNTEDVCAFEITFPSLEHRNIYDSVLKKNISTVKLYTLPNGLPELVQKQPVYLRKDDVGYPSLFE